MTRSAQPPPGRFSRALQFARSRVRAGAVGRHASQYLREGQC
jgi:hypothetical protein